MRIFIGADHNGFEMKEYIKNCDFSKNINFIDTGTYTKESCDYPKYAKKTIKYLKKEIPFFKTSKQTVFGILICGTGFGMSMVANRYKKIRAVVCRNVFEAKMAREHNNANVLCIGANITKKEDIKDIIETFITTEFLKGRHSRRIKKF